jgi:hypothetical protein
MTLLENEGIQKCTCADCIGVLIFPLFSQASTFIFDICTCIYILYIIYHVHWHILMVRFGVMMFNTTFIFDICTCIYILYIIYHVHCHILMVRLGVMMFNTTFIFDICTCIYILYIIYHVHWHILMVRFGVMVFNTPFNSISVISWQFYWWRKLEYPEKTTDLSQVTDSFIT